MTQNRIWVLMVVFVFATSVFSMPTRAVADEQITVIGTLQKSKRGIVLNTDKETYLIIGQDLSTLVGRKVKVSGKPIENYSGKSLLVSIVELVHG